MKPKTKEEKLETRRRWRERNREKIKKTMVAYRLKYKEELKLRRIK